MRDIVREELIAELLALKPEFEGKGVTHVALFGSRARRDNRPDSDIDLVIDVSERQKFSLIDLAGVARTVEDRLGIPANMFMRRSLEPEFLAAVRDDQLPVF